MCKKRRLGVAKCPDPEIVLNTPAREMHDSDRQLIEHSVIALEWRGFGVLCRVGLKATCGTLRLSAPLGGDQLGPFGDPPCSNTMSACLAYTWSSLAQINR